MPPPFRRSAVVQLPRAAGAVLLVRLHARRCGRAHRLDVGDGHRVASPRLRGGHVLQRAAGAGRARHRARVARAVSARLRHDVGPPDSRLCHAPRFRRATAAGLSQLKVCGAPREGPHHVDPCANGTGPFAPAGGRIRDDRSAAARDQDTGRQAAGGREEEGQAWYFGDCVNVPL